MVIEPLCQFFIVPCICTIYNIRRIEHVRKVFVAQFGIVFQNPWRVFVRLMPCFCDFFRQFPNRNKVILSHGESAWLISAVGVAVLFVVIRKHSISGARHRVVACVKSVGKPLLLFKQIVCFEPCHFFFCFVNVRVVQFHDAFAVRLPRLHGKHRVLVRESHLLAVNVRARLRALPFRQSEAIGNVHRLDLARRVPVGALRILLSLCPQVTEAVVEVDIFADRCLAVVFLQRRLCHIPLSCRRTLEQLTHVRLKENVRGVEVPQAKFELLFLGGLQAAAPVVRGRTSCKAFDQLDRVLDLMNQRGAFFCTTQPRVERDTVQTRIKGSLDVI